MLVFREAVVGPERLGDALIDRDRNACALTDETDRLRGRSTRCRGASASGSGSAPRTSRALKRSGQGEGQRTGGRRLTLTGAGTGEIHNIGIAKLMDDVLDAGAGERCRHPHIHGIRTNRRSMPA